MQRRTATFLDYIHNRWIKAQIIDPRPLKPRLVLQQELAQELTGVIHSDWLQIRYTIHPQVMEPNIKTLAHQ